MYKTKKSQIAVTDLYLALTIATILFVTLVVSYYSNLKRLDHKIVVDELRNQGYQITDLLVKTTGKPINWEKSTKIEIIGLALSDRFLSEKKVDAFTDMDYEQSKRLLGIGRFDYYFSIKDLDNNALAESGIFPISKNIVNIQRAVHYLGNNSILEFKIWEK